MIKVKSTETQSLLIIDDNKCIQNIVQKIIQESQFDLHVLEALTGEEALNILQSSDLTTKPSFIMLDLNLPAMNGHDVLKKIQQDDTLKQIPIIVLTASDDPSELEILKKNGAQECHTKPFDFLIFNQLVEKIIKKWIAP